MDKLFKELAKTLALEQINNEMECSEEYISERFQELMDEKYILLKPKLLNKAIKRSKRNNKTSKSFLQNNLKRWEKPFELLDALHLLCIDSVADINNKFRKSNRDDILFDVLLRLHAHACHLASEIICLMKNGYPNGGYSIWRTLYETYITALFIKANGKECAQRFVDHSIVDHFNLMKKCITHKDKINQSPPSESDYQQFKVLFEQTCSKYEDKFNKSYGWAIPYIKGNPSFTAIEESIDQGHFRFYYSKVSSVTHCSYYGLIKKLGLSETPYEVLLVGQSDADMLEPGNCVALTLTQITCVLLEHSMSNGKSKKHELLLMKILDSIQHEITNEFINYSKLDGPRL